MKKYPLFLKSGSKASPSKPLSFAFVDTRFSMSKKVYRSSVLVFIQIIFPSFWTMKIRSSPAWVNAKGWLKLLYIGSMDILGCAHEKSGNNKNNRDVIVCL